MYKKIDVSKEIKSDIKKQIILAEKGNGYGDGFKYVPFYGKFVIKFNGSEKEFDFILDALNFYNSIKKDKAFWDCTKSSELIDCQ